VVRVRRGMGSIKRVVKWGERPQVREWGRVKVVQIQKERHDELGVLVLGTGGSFRQELKNQRRGKHERKSRSPRGLRKTEKSQERPRKNLVICLRATRARIPKGVNRGMSAPGVGGTEFFCRQKNGPDLRSEGRRKPISS